MTTLTAALIANACWQQLVLQAAKLTPKPHTYIIEKYIYVSSFYAFRAFVKPLLVGKAGALSSVEPAC